MVAPPNVFSFDLQAARQAASNWLAQTDVRERKTSAAREGRYDVAESKYRLAKWVNRRLGQVRDSLPDPVALPESLAELVSQPPVTPREIDNQLVERVIGATRDFLAVAFLDRAVQAARSVGRIETRLPGGRRGYGTGFMVSSRLLLTNNHVLATPELAANSTVEFDYQLDYMDQPLSIHRFVVQPDRFFVTDKALDFSLVAVAPTASTGQALADYGWCPLIKEEGKILVGEPINIVQHPRGEMKQIVIRENLLLDLMEDAPFAHYQADTEPGSSGSPVFNDRWEVVALHHSGVPATDAQGRLLDVDGGIWEDGDDPQRLAWIANEGIRVSRLMAFIENAPIEPHEQRLRDDLLSGREPLPTRRRLGVDSGTGEVQTPSHGSVPTSTSAGAVPSSSGIVSSSPEITFTVPVQITVSVGVAGPGNVAVSATSTAAPPLLEAIQPDTDYAARPGYDANFLGFAVPLPDLTDAIRVKAVQIEGATPNRYELKYHHYSVIMNAERRLAFVAAVNIDPLAAVNHRREGNDRWFFDPRIDRDLQAGNEFYASNPLDRGHLVRRADAAWGASDTEAKRANDDTFHFTNCTPQHEVFNQSTKADQRGLRLWGNIEEHIAQQAEHGARQLCVFNGPVFRDDDRKHRGLKLPREFWKIVAFSTTAGMPSAVAFILSQHDLIKDLPPEEFQVGPYASFQVKILKIEQLTGLDFSQLKTHDPLESTVHEAFLETGTQFVPLSSLAEIVL
ncbi:MAG: DNA/RNA non-specific endonuclease [Actinomycetota bacterium]|nr:DNA/RNA non-specific endonuclease [Actinomycetota bacterium]